jgi:hypothetical protein
MRGRESRTELRGSALVTRGGSFLLSLYISEVTRMRHLLEQVVGWGPLVLEYGAVVFPLFWYAYRLHVLISK